MRILMGLIGVIFMCSGGYVTAHDGTTFLSVAFIIGWLFIIAGVAETLSYSGNRSDNEDKSWILIDGLTTFAIGILILANRMTTDTVTAGVLGIWVLITGIRNMARAWENIYDRKNHFWSHLIIGIVNMITGIYTYFNGDLFNLPVITTIGFCIIVQGINIIHVGMTIRITKPHFIKTKEERLADAMKNAEIAHAAAKEAIAAARSARLEVKNIEETPEELLDAALAPKPVKGEIEEIPEDASIIKEKNDADDGE